MEILKRGREALKSCRSLILQPQSEIWNVRRYLDENEWRIQEENMILEEGKFYPMLRAGREGSEKLDQVQLFYGPRLLERRHPVLLSYLKKEREKLKEVREKLARSESSRQKTGKERYESCRT